MARVSFNLVGPYDVVFSVVEFGVIRCTFPDDYQNVTNSTVFILFQPNFTGVSCDRPLQRAGIV